MNTNAIKLCVLGLLLALFTGCTSAPLQLSADTYMISKSSGAGMFASKAGMQAKAIKAANRFAASKGKAAVARGSSWDKPFIGAPTFTYQFILVDKDDPRAKDVSLKPVADVTVEVAK
jgi:hypothetical protein